KIFDNFIDKFIRVSLSEYDDKTIRGLDDKYDLFICGSDQIWSPYSAGFDPIYFLDFVKKRNKKNAYAASFGVEIVPEETIKEYSRRLKNFNVISVREEIGKKIIKNLIEEDVPVSLDPTLLLSKTEWDLIIEKKRKISEKYLLIYLITETREIIELAKKVAREKKLKLVYINDNIYKTKGIYNYNNCSPSDWLNLFYNADYIVTNSFHGIAFSINFEKEFSVQYLPEPAKVNSRINNILDNYSLKWRINYDGNEKINYSKVNKILVEDRVASQQILKDIMEY
ncbi:TPA: polysaccharide pyruvyl transferase family protein, partial [Enterococcus faecium]